MNTRTRTFGAFAAAIIATGLTAVGCGGSAGPVVSRSRSANSEASYGNSAAGASAAPASASYESSPSESRSDKSGAQPSARDEAQRPERRQGLATETNFERESSPFYTTTIRYNDRRGIAAMTNAHESERARVRNGYSADALIDVRIVDDGGSSFEMFREDPSHAYVIGQKGARYSILVSNHTDDRIEAVTSVDGLDALDGRPATLTKRGYIVDAHGSVRIDGFRQSDRTVAAFRFGSVGESYAASKGDTRDVGVIGVAAFGDRDARDSLDTRRRLRARPFGDSDPRYAQPPR
jgi:hypothetical protein